jgi:hypothetical protein
MATAQLHRSAPYFLVPDVDDRVVRYAREFGFEPTYVSGSPAEFAIVERDGFAIMLRRGAAQRSSEALARSGGTWDCFFWVSGVRELSAELETRGAAIKYPLTYQPSYGMLEFAVRDLDGYVLGFGETTRAAHEE